VFFILLAVTSGWLDEIDIGRSLFLGISVWLTVVIVFGFLVAPRALSLPTLAIDDARFTVTLGWDITGRNGPRLFVLAAISLLPMLVYQIVLAGIDAAIPELPLAGRLVEIANALLLYPAALTVEAIMWASVLS
jgi:hypothetical protein